MPTNRKLWSVPRIKHPKYPAYTVRVGEFEPSGSLHVFRWDREKGQQTSRALKCRRVDLGPNPKAQEKEARRIGCEVIEALATKPAPSADPEPPTSKGLTLAKLADKYELDGFAGRTANYKRDSLAAVRRVAAYLGADLLVAELKPSHVQKYVAYKVALKRAPAGRGDLVALSIACNWAVGEGLLDTSPLAGKRAKDAMRIAHQQSRPVASADRYAKLKETAPQLPPMFGVVLDLAWHTGHRISAILGLRWQDVSFDRTEDAPHGTIRWYASAIRDRKKHDHTLPMNAAARAALQAWRKKQKASVSWVFPAPTDPSKPLERWVAKQWLKNAERDANLPHVPQGGWHMFRRGWATARKHMPLQDVAAGGGWTDTATVLKCYQHADAETTRQATTFVA